MKNIKEYINEAYRFRDMDLNGLEAFCTLCCKYFEKFGTKDDFIDFEKFDDDSNWFFSGVGYPLQKSLLKKTGDKYERAAKQLYKSMKEYYETIK